MNNKLSKLIAIVGSILILTIGGITFNQIYKNHQANELIIEKCFENFDQVEDVVIKKDGFWSPVICEKNSIKDFKLKSFNAIKYIWSHRFFIKSTDFGNMLFTFISFSL